MRKRPGTPSPGPAPPSALRPSADRVSGPQGFSWSAPEAPKPSLEGHTCQAVSSRGAPTLRNCQFYLEPKPGGPTLKGGGFGTRIWVQPEPSS